MSVFVEFTERALLDDPAVVLMALARVRSLGFGVAIDDLGADPASLALLPFMEPDVIKLDLHLVQQRADDEIAAIVTAVRADLNVATQLFLRKGSKPRCTSCRSPDACATADRATGWFAAFVVVVLPVAT